MIRSGNFCRMDDRIAEYMPVFRKNYLVYGLPDEAIEQVAGLAEYRAFISGEKLVYVGEKSSDLYVILDGEAHIYGTEGDRISIAKPPSILGEIALVDNLERSADAIAVGLVKTAKFPGTKLRKYMNDNKEVGFTMLANLCRVLSMRLRKTNVTLVDLMGKVQDHWKNVT